MSTDQKKKPLNHGFLSKLKTMTPEEKRLWYAARREKIAKVKSNRREEIQEWKRETLKLISASISYDTTRLDEPGFQPSQSTLWKLFDLFKQGFSTGDIRDWLLSEGLCSETGWGKIKRVLFEKHLAKIEDLGIDYLANQRKGIDGIEKQIRYLERMKKAKPNDTKIPSEIITAYMHLQRLQNELGKFLMDTGTIGEKKKGGVSITLISNTPRPSEPRVVEEVQTLDHPLQEDTATGT